MEISINLRLICRRCCITERGELKSMIKELFEFNNIKYVVSVDDCYFAPKPEEIKAKIYSEMCESIEPFRECLKNLGKEEQVNVYEELKEYSGDGATVLATLLEELSPDELMEINKLTDQNESIYDKEQKGIQDFLNGIQADGCIERYLTFSTTKEAACFDVDAEKLNAGGILWLLDRNFERVGEAPDAGINLAKTLIQRNDGRENFVYILSAVGNASEQNEDDIEAEFDDVLSNECDLTEASFVYYINKDRVLDNKERLIARSLAQGFKRKACYELFGIYKDCLVKSVDTSKEKIHRIKQGTLNYLFDKVVNDKGESSLELLTRLVQIFQVDEYNKKLAQTHDLIADKLSYYESLCSVVKDLEEGKKITPILKEFRNVELYNRHINQQHLEISTGDVFEVGGEYYVLVSQACDISLRKNGERKLRLASLLKIEDSPKEKFKYSLSCFMEYEKPAVLYQSQTNIPFELLDLCVLNCDGQAKLKTEWFGSDEKLALHRYTPNYIARIKLVIATIRQIYESKFTLMSYWEGKKEISLDCAKTVYESLTNVDPWLKKFDVLDGSITYQIKRICRLNEMVANDIVRQYGVTLSRIGHPFDFSD